MKKSSLSITLVLVLLLGLFSNSYSLTCVLNVPLKGQLESNWCWAACSDCVLGYFGGAPGQPAIANWACATNGVWCPGVPNCGTDCLCAPHPCATCCNQSNFLYGVPEAIDGIIMQFGAIGSAGVAFPLTPLQIQADVCPPDCKPWIIRWGWNTGGGHFVVGHGYDAATTNVWYMDPWPVGFGSFNIALYAWVVAGGGHTWTHSLRMTPAGPTAIELAGFSATGFDSYIEIEWTTGNEINSEGFNLYRSRSEDGELSKLNEGLIAAKGDELQGASYSFKDHDVAGGDTYYYWVEDVGLSGNGIMHGPVLASKNDAKTPTVLRLAQNYPNPFNPVTEIRYDLPEDCHVKLEVYNVLGQRVATLVDDIQTAGTKVARWNGKNGRGIAVSDGIYFYRLEAGGFFDIKKMVLLK